MSTVHDADVERVDDDGSMVKVHSVSAVATL
jgi:hypothetical protein